MKLLGRLLVWCLALITISLFSPDAVYAAQAGKSTLQEFVVTIGGFLQNIVLPFLFTIAFLFFIFNTARYFIIDGANEIDREKAKRSALYGVLAFVFLVSLWAIVNLFLNGLGLNNRTALCPDYFPLFGSSKCIGLVGGGIGNGQPLPNSPVFPGSNPGSGGGTNTGGNGGGNNGTGNTNTGGGNGGGNNGTGGTNTGGTNGGNGGGPVGDDAPLAELIFGTGKDGATYFRSNVPSSAITQTPIIATSTTCAVGLKTLKASAGVETTQAAYLYYKTTTGNKEWRNVTSKTTGNLIEYDRDVIDAILAAGATNVYLIHTHPKQRASALSLAIQSQGPSVADFRAMCGLNRSTISYLTVGAGGLWLTTHTPTTCPYSVSALAILPTIETYLNLATLQSSAREDELTAYLGSSLVPAPQKTHFNTLDRSTIESKSVSEILTLAQPFLTKATTTVQYLTDIDAFCASR